MATVHKQKDSPYYYAHFRIPQPSGSAKQVKRSTGKTNRNDAMKVAITLEEAALTEAGAGDDKSKRIMRVMTQVSQDAVRGVLNASVARSYIAEIVKISTGEDLPAFSIRTWTEEWIIRKQDSGCVLSTIRRYRSSTKVFLKWLGDGADKPLESVTTTQIRTFRTSIKDAGRASRTVNNIMKDVSGIFLSAVNEGLIQHNPAAPLKALDNSDSLSREPFTTPEVSKLVAAAPTPDWKGLITMAAFTGLRLEDCSHITWDDVDLIKGIIKTMPSKTKRMKRTVVIPMHSNLRDFLYIHPSSDDPKSPVFPTLANLPVGGSSGLSSTFTGTIMKAAGVSRGEVKKVAENAKVGRTIYARGFHSLRHTFTSWLANSNVPNEVRMKMTGHSTTEIHEIYTHFDTEVLKSAIAELDGLT